MYFVDKSFTTLSTVVFDGEEQTWTGVGVVVVISIATRATRSTKYIYQLTSLIAYYSK